MSMEYLRVEHYPKHHRALQELQITLNIARRNSLEDENDTWVLFSEQYLEVIHQGTRPEER
jgi:hypothetical protein